MYITSPRSRGDQHQLHHVHRGLVLPQSTFHSLALFSSRLVLMSATFTMEPSKLKTEVTTSDFDQESRSLNSKVRLINSLDLATQALTVLALIAGTAVLGLSADALKIYNETHVAPEYLLPLWPENVDVRGSVSLVACSAIVAVVSLLALVLSKVSTVRPPSRHAKSWAKI